MNRWYNIPTHDVCKCIYIYKTHHKNIKYVYIYISLLYQRIEVTKSTLSMQGPCWTWSPKLSPLNCPLGGSWSIKLRVTIKPGWWFQLFWKIWVRHLGVLFPIYGKCSKPPTRSNHCQSQITTAFVIISHKLFPSTCQKIKDNNPQERTVK